MIPACRARPRPRHRPRGIPVHQTVMASNHARQRFPGSRAPVSDPALSLPATPDTIGFPIRHSPNLNAYSERWVKSVKEECLSKLILFGERSLRRALQAYVEHYHGERNHQGKDNVLLFPQVSNSPHHEQVQCRERLGGLLRYYHRAAA
jgi:hypothetical protein